MRKHYFLAWLLVMTMLCSLALCACTDHATSNQPPADDVASVSLERLRSAMSLDEARATELWELLVQSGFEGEVLFAYPAKDEAALDYYHIWMGDETVDVYMKDDGTVAAIQASGVLLWGELPVTSDSSGTQNTGVTLTPGEHTAQVEAGADGRVCVFGTPGVEYKIKVYYASGVSTAQALSPKIADEDGCIVWEWTVSSRAKPGVYKIEVLCADNESDMITLAFEVLEKTQ